MVVERRRHGVEFANDVVVANPVQFVGADAGLDVRADHAQNLRGELAGNTHALDLLGGLDGMGQWAGSVIS